MITTFTRYRKYLIPAVLVGSLAGGLAISQGGLAIAQGGLSGLRGFMHTPPSPEAIKRMQDGEIAGAVAALKMSDDQLKLWAPLEKAIRDQQAERLKMMQDRMAAQANGAAPATPPAVVALPDRLDKMAEQAGKRAEQLKVFSVAFKPFYATLSDPQKEVVGPLLAHLERGGSGHGHGDDGPGGFGHGHHGKHGGQMDGGPGPDGNQ